MRVIEWSQDSAVMMHHRQYNLVDVSQLTLQLRPTYTTHNALTQDLNQINNISAVPDAHHPPLCQSEFQRPPCA
jgi:hypothetical protein